MVIYSLNAAALAFVTDSSNIATARAIICSMESGKNYMAAKCIFYETDEFVRLGLYILHLGALRFESINFV